MPTAMRVIVDVVTSWRGRSRQRKMAPVAFAAARTVRNAPCRSCRCQALSKRNAAGTAVAGFAAAALLVAAPAMAGIQLEQPKLKKAFVTPDEPTEVPKLEIPLEPLKAKAKKAVAAVSGEAGSGKPAAPKDSKEEAPMPFNTQSLWPLGLVAVGAGIYGLGKVDNGFAKLLDNAVKDSGVDGIGSEDVLKEAGGYSAAYYEENGAPNAIKARGGTKMLKK